MSTRKNKLRLKEIRKCNPRVTARRKQCIPDDIYKNVAKTLRISKYKKPENVQRFLGCEPGEEHCFLDKAPINEDTKKQLRKEYLRPRYPKGWINDPDMWLDNFNIQNVLSQYQAAYPWFKFLGVFPIDFSAPNPYTQDHKQCLNKELCTINLKEEYAKGIRGLGAIFNLDPHFKSGSHWVGLYIDLHSIKKPKCSYFDSYGYKTPPLIARLMKSFRLQIPSIELGYNARRFQYGNSECGMFSMYFIICMLSGISFKAFCKDSVNDTYMLELRKILFQK